MDSIKNKVRSVMRRIAGWIDRLSGGAVTPDTITLIGLVAHLPIALLIFMDKLVIAGVLLIVFGLFDTLDGELARLQKRTSARGMFLDSATDRMKELMIYIGLSAWLAQTQTTLAPFVLLTGALGVSIITSYFNAWGEAVIGRQGKPKTKLNKTFRGGILSFEIRITLLIVGLLFGQIIPVIAIIATLGTVTLAQRLASILKALKNV